MPIVSLILAGALAAAPAPSAAAGGYVGRWNVQITDATDTFASGGFDIAEKDGALAASLVWRWGSFAPVHSATLRDGTLVMLREEVDEDGETKRDTFEVRLDGDVLRGTVTYPDGKQHHFEGRRAPTLAADTVPDWGDPITLFDGKTLAGWKLRDLKKQNGWAVVDGDLAVVEPEDNADLVSERAFQDFKLHIEFNVDPESNSGVYLRGRYEVQILDNPDAAMALDSHGCGGVYSRIAPKLDATKPAGEWQTYDITFVGRQLRVVLNGKAIVDASVEGITGGAISPYEHKPGPLMLQGDHGKVRFRNIVVTPAR
jgi:hypothetical protein